MNHDSISNSWNSVSQKSQIIFLVYYYHHSYLEIVLTVHSIMKLLQLLESPLNFKISGINKEAFMLAFHCKFCLIFWYNLCLL